LENKFILILQFDFSFMSFEDLTNISLSFLAFKALFRCIFPIFKISHFTLARIITLLILFNLATAGCLVNNLIISFFIDSYKDNKFFLYIIVIESQLLI